IFIIWVIMVVKIHLIDIPLIENIVSFWCKYTIREHYSLNYVVVGGESICSGTSHSDNSLPF
ncbi:TPA: hypothetical protein ACLGSX_001050, partial [Salmonella enterica]